MLQYTTPEQAKAILGGMLGVAATRGMDRVSEADRTSLAAVNRYIFRRPEPLDVAGLPLVRPPALAAVVTDREMAAEALRFLAVMALVDGVLDNDKIATVLDYAKALDIHDEAYLTELAEAAQGHLRWALMDMTRRNMESITGKPWLTDDAMPWLLPYKGTGADPALAARYHALGQLPDGSFGRTFWNFYQANGYSFPGEESALNEAFATPHDSVHIVTGCDTSPHGELLVSTFTAAMHPKWPMAGHILPVIFSWHLGIKINDVAKSAVGGFDPERFWLAWARGTEIDVDLFGPDWDFWAWADESLAELRRRHRVRPLAA